MDEESLSRVAGELRRLRHICVALLAVLSLLLALSLYGQLRLCIGLRRPESVGHSWKDVDFCMAHQDFCSALDLAQEMRDEKPENYVAYDWLGAIHLARGELEKAEEAFAKAYELFPIERYRERLHAVRQRLGGTEPESP